MGESLNDIAEKLITKNKKTHLIYAFNGTGKTRLSREFKDLLNLLPAIDEDIDEPEQIKKKILYYNAFTEDLFYWDNDLNHNQEPKLIIQPNEFTQWILETQGQDQNIISLFQRYTNRFLTPKFNENFTEVSFTLQRGNKNDAHFIKISKGEESVFIWCIFYALFNQVIEVLNTKIDERETQDFDDLEWVFVDDPVSSLDENHLIELAVDLAQLIKSSNKLKFVITTHNPLFYNVLYNELSGAIKWLLKKHEDETYELLAQTTDSPFSYHLYLKHEIRQAIDSNNVNKYHYNFMRNILEKSATFLGYKTWEALLPTVEGKQDNPYAKRVINISSHSKHSGEESSIISEDDKRVLKYVFEQIDEKFKFASAETEAPKNKD